MTEIQNKRKLTISYDDNINATVKKSKIMEDEDEFKDLLNDDFFSESFDFDELSKLDFTQWQRCLIAEISITQKEIILKLKSESGEQNGICYVQGAWTSLKLKVGDLLSIQAPWDDSIKQFVVSSSSGMIVQNPDFLISGTSVVGSLFCMRKGVLSDRFKGIDGGNKIMTIGCLVHELFQEVLKKKLISREQITNTARELILSQRTILSLYSNEMTLQETLDDVYQYIPNIVNFSKRYLDSSSHKTYNDSNYDGKIDSIRDIEENIWMPKYGLKGKIDVTVKMGDSKIMPLEVKTGRTSFSLEHKGQVGIYQIMMAELDPNVKAGLLLYLKDGAMKEMSVNHNEKRDLIILRNNLSYYLTKRIVENDGKFEISELPEPINHHSACSKCPYNIICCSYLARDNETVVSSNNPIQLVRKDALHHLKESAVDYFVMWAGLVTLEHEQNRKENQQNRLWTKKLLSREKSGVAIGNLILEGRVFESENTYYHNFSRENNENIAYSENSNSTMAIGDYVIVSTKHRIAIAAGRIQLMSKIRISLALERDLSIHYKSESFIIDQHVSDSMLSFNLTNLGALMDCTEAANRLRMIVVDKIEPAFKMSQSSPLPLKAKDVLMALNAVQRRAVLKAIAAQDYLLLKGLPGTGKTQTLVTLIQIFVMLGKSVLLTSHTHSAVDNVLLRLKSATKIPFLRLGSASRINETLLEHSESALTENCKDPNELAATYNQFSVVACTCHGSHHPLLSQKEFDVCIVDEATQVFQLAVIRTLLAAKKFILVGDPEQLPPIIRSARAKTLGADKSLFARLDSETATFSLTLQYRMNKVITKLANKLTYNGRLECANEQLANMAIQIPKFEVIQNSYSTEKWLNKALSRNIDQSVVIVDTGNVFERSWNAEILQRNDSSFVELNVSASEMKQNKNTLYVNHCETALVLYLIEALMKSGVKGSAIGIIAPYRAQVEFLKESVIKFEEMLTNTYSGIADGFGIEVNTVDQYQGRDKEIIIYSCTKSVNTAAATSTAPKSDMEILSDHRRLTVAVTRAKYKLIILGDVESLNPYAPFASLFTHVNKMSHIPLIDGKMGFSWVTVLNCLESVLNPENLKRRKN